MAWVDVEFNTTLPPEAKKVVLSDLNGIWRKWKHSIKEDYFLPHLDDEKYLSQLPTDRIELDQWLDLVEYWKDEDVQKIAAKNAKDVCMKECLHRTGRIPFTVLEQAFIIAGVDPINLDIWMESRARGKGLGDDGNTFELYNNCGKSKKQKTVQDYYDNSIKIGTRVHLFCHRIPKSIVAQGVVVDLIGGEKKDRHVFVKVYIEKALIPNEKLLRPYEGARTIGEAIHKCINWEFDDVMEI